MTRIICHTGLLSADDLTGGSLWCDGTLAEIAPLLTKIDQVVQRLRMVERIAFRFEDFERQHVLWQRVGLAAAIVQEHRKGQLHRLHLLSRGPTGEVWWERRIARADDSEAGLLGMLVLVPAFAEWSEPHHVLRPF